MVVYVWCILFRPFFMQSQCTQRSPFFVFTCYAMCPMCNEKKLELVMYCKTRTIVAHITLILISRVPWAILYTRVARSTQHASCLDMFPYSSPTQNRTAPEKRNSCAVMWPPKAKTIHFMQIKFNRSKYALRTNARALSFARIISILHTMRAALITCCARQPNRKKPREKRPARTIHTKNNAHILLWFCVCRIEQCIGPKTTKKHGETSISKYYQQ